MSDKEKEEQEKKEKEECPQDGIFKHKPYPEKNTTEELPEI